MPTEVYYTINEVAGLTGLHRNTIRFKIRTGQLPARIEFGKFGDEYRIARSALFSAGLLAEAPGADRASDGAPSESGTMDPELMDEPAASGTVTGSSGSHEEPVPNALTPAVFNDLLGRHEQAMFRLGYLQGELERTRALAETAESLRDAAEEQRSELSTWRSRAEALPGVEAALDQSKAECEALRTKLVRAEEEVRELQAVRKELEVLRGLLERQEEEIEALRSRRWWQWK